jgi:hypothetical protein
VDHPRDWIDVSQALLTPLVAVIAVWVGTAQWWTARNKFKLDLFDRRWSVYIATRKFLSELAAHAGVSEDARVEFLIGIRGAKWLFDDRIDAYLYKELHRQALALNALNSILEPNVAEHERPANAKKKYETMLWVVDQDAITDAMFGEFLRMDQPFFAWLGSRKIARQIAWVLRFHGPKRVRP